MSGPPIIRNRARPKVLVNFACTWDGKISTRNLTPSDFSSKQGKRRLLEIRARGDALLVGKGTLAAENMSMGLPAADLQAARLSRGQTQFPLRVVVSNSGRIDPALKVFQKRISPIVIYSTERMSRRLRVKLSGMAAVHLTECAALDLREVLRDLREHYGVKVLVCEGGPTLLRALLEKDLVDEINITLCPRVFGGRAAPTLTGPPGEFLGRVIQCRLLEKQSVGGEFFLRYKITHDSLP